MELLKESYIRNEKQIRTKCQKRPRPQIKKGNKVTKNFKKMWNARGGQEKQYSNPRTHGIRGRNKTNIQNIFRRGAWCKK